MDRERIERRDFPTGRRGYDPAAVDEHLRSVADEFEAQLRAPRPSLAESTSEQVRLILDAAERGASELRTRAGEEASDHVARVQASASGMLSKLDALETELNRLLSALRASGERLTEGLEQLQADVSEGLSEAPPADAGPALSSPGGTIADAPPAGSSPAAEAARAESSPAAEPVDPPDSVDPADPVDPPDPADPPDPPDPLDPAAAAGANGSPPPEDTLFDPGFDALEEDFAAASEPADAGARLIALNMALSGSPREETARYLAEHFDLDDAEALLDDVYTRAGR